MRTVGSLLKLARIEKKYSIADVSELTKIRESFIDAIERGQWEVLPDYPVVVGFVKNLSQTLDLDERHVISFLRRDYPPAKTKPLAPKPDEKKKFSWGPRMTFLAGIGVVLLIILGYLGFQYKKFMSPPTLTVSVPTEGQVVREFNLSVSGKTDPDATIKVNNQSALVGDNGDFATEIEVSKDTKEVVVTAKSRSGRESTIHRRIEVQL